MCPECGGSDLLLHGAGTQRVEQELAGLFPTARVLRMDLDTTSRKGAHERLLRQFGSGSADILLGTQMVAKGLDFPRVTLVGVVSADTQMLLPDFRASERTFQLLTQVAGRAGRSSLRGEVIIQTLQPSHPALQHVVRHDYTAFYSEEIAAREELAYPPFTRLVLFELKGPEEARVQREAAALASRLKDAGVQAQILGPSPAVIPRIRNQFRWHVLLKNPRTGDPSGNRLRTEVRRALSSFSESTSRTVTLTIDADPIGLL
jgi:primosomal protein N' (replication factor Y)